MNPLTTTDPLLDHLAVALAGTDAVLAAIRPVDEAAGTPCPGWDVATVADHLVGALEMFGAAAGGAMPDAAGSRLERYRAGSAAALAAWTAPGRLDSPVALPFGTFPGRLAVTINLLETYVHTCDLAVATGTESLVDGSLCDEIRSAAEAAGFDAFRQPGMFGPATEPSGDTGLARLLAFTGRAA